MGLSLVAAALARATSDQTPQLCARSPQPQTQRETHMKIVTVAGARPNFMKVAPILAALRRRSGATTLLVHTGQHYDQAMSGNFLRDLGIPEPDTNLEVGSGSHAEQTGRTMIAFERFCSVQHPDCVIVVGDVNSTVACAITAKKLGITVAHV